MAKRKKRDWHPNFKKYMQFIAEHPNYVRMPFLYKKDGSIRWVVTRGSVAGQARLKWWDEKRKELGLPTSDAWISKTARAIHPTGEKPCQICGETLKLDYLYPNGRGSMSPGAMSNAPDRLDGYHSYNRCCRGEHDTGRHKSNLARYGEDRRAYENWSDGDWKAASWLMKEFQKHGMSPDHLGPISLGFQHYPKFRPLTRAANSARNNRMTYEDIKLLVNEEKKSKIISLHSQFIWNLLKDKVKNDADALRLSKLMRENMHYILSVFSYLAERGCKDFLANNFLHPEYAEYSIKFEGFNSRTGTYENMVKTKGTKKQYINNAKRYIRISFESLKQYSLKENRNLKKGLSDKVEDGLLQIVDYLKEKNEEQALSELFKTFKVIAENLAKKF